MRNSRFIGSEFLTIANLDAAGGKALTVPAGTKRCVIHVNLEAAGGHLWVNVNAAIPSATNSAKIPVGSSFSFDGHPKDLICKNVVAGNCSALVIYYGP